MAMIRSPKRLLSLVRDPLTTGDKLRNHCHLTGTFLGVAHNVFNLNYKMPDHIPVLFHNMRGYDCQNLILCLGKYNDEDISCIATISESYVFLSLNSLRFVDTIQFLNRCWTRKSIICLRPVATFPYSDSVSTNTTICSYARGIQLRVR